MQEELAQKTVALVFRAASFTARHFEAVLREVMNMPMIVYTRRRI